MTNSHTATWAESYTKLLAFNQTDYHRILHLDSDGTALQSMDELFLLAPAFVAMPRAYWLPFSDRILSSQLLLLEPSLAEFERVMNVTQASGKRDYDMDILTTMYQDSAMVLPHRPYNILTAEFRRKEDHQNYLGNPTETWDPDAALKEAKYLHFSDWPLPKVCFLRYSMTWMLIMLTVYQPWLASPEAVDQAKPLCGRDPATNLTTSCRGQTIFTDIYADFRRRRSVRY